MVLGGFSPRLVGLHLTVEVWGGLTHYTVCELPTPFYAFYSDSFFIVLYGGNLLSQSTSKTPNRINKPEHHCYIMPRLHVAGPHPEERLSASETRGTGVQHWLTGRQLLCAASVCEGWQVAIEELL